MEHHNVGGPWAVVTAKQLQTIYRNRNQISAFYYYSLFCTDYLRQACVVGVGGNSTSYTIDIERYYMKAEYERSEKCRRVWTSYIKYLI